MTTPNNTLMAEIEERLDDLSSNISDDIGEAVEVGAILAALIKKAASIQDGLKGILREEALRRLQNAPGTVEMQGDGNGLVSVTVPTPKLQLTKDADIGLLFKVLGDDFDLYFETDVKYKPRKATPNLIEGMEDGTPKTVLLSSLQENEGTPRVSFKRS